MAREVKHKDRKRVLVSMGKKELEQVDKAAAEMGVSRNEMMLQAIKEKLEK